MKHIESIQPEYAADDMTALLLTDATASAALSRLLHDWTGCAIPPTADTPQSEVEELVPLCLSILRRHWTTPLTALGDGTTPMSLADLMRRLILGRVDGNEALGIPPANANIPTAVAALTKRHIDDGLTLTLTDGTDGSTTSPTTSPTTTSLPDGLSLAQLLCSGLADNITEITDTNVGWKYKNQLQNILAIFPNMTKLTLGMGEISNMYISSITTPRITEFNAPYLKKALRCCLDRGMSLQELYLPSLEVYRGGNSSTYGFLGMVNGDQTIKKINVPNMREFYFGRLAVSCPELTEVITGIEKYDERGGYLYMLPTCLKVEKLVFGTIKEWYMQEPNNRSGICASPYLVHLEIQGCVVSLDLRSWNPTTALAERLPEFLSNFKTYIANRLTDKGSGLTLTLSQAVRDAIQQDPDIVNIITSKGWTISPAPSV